MNNGVIEHIASGYVYTSTGQRFNIKQLNGTPRKGYAIDENFNVVNNGSVDADCPGGSCPIK